jgi:GH35 family endo-1,4-beta-xylanase
MIKEFLSKGASIDKIGGQHHIFSGVDGTPVADDLLKSKGSLDPERMIQGLERMAEFGKPLEITEVTIPTVDDSEEAEQLQAEMLRELYTLWFATPRMESVVYWNVADFTAVVDGDEWDENRCRGGLFNYDMTPKRSALELKRLFTEEWHTEEELVSDEQGVVRFRGFFGDYKASVGNESFNFGLHRAQPTRTTHQMFI